MTTCCYRTPPWGRRREYMDQKSPPVCFSCRSPRGLVRHRYRLSGAYSSLCTALRAADLSSGCFGLVALPSFAGMTVPPQDGDRLARLPVTLSWSASGDDASRGVVAPAIEPACRLRDRTRFGDPTSGEVLVAALGLPQSPLHTRLQDAVEQSSNGAPTPGNRVEILSVRAPFRLA